MVQTSGPPRGLARGVRPGVVALVALGLGALAARDGLAARFLFDASHGQSAGNADWVVDADLRNLDWTSSGGFNRSGNESNPQRYPTPASTGITAVTSETYWNGAVSAWAVDLVKRGHSVECLPPGSNLVFGTAAAQDLTNYDVVVMDEPNTAFRSGEKAALLSFVAAGGGLFMAVDHTVSDRNGDGLDSVDIWRDFFTNNGVTNNPFGITLPTVEDFSGTSSTSTRRTDPADPLIFGPVGTVSKIQFFNGCRFAIDTNRNPTVLGHIWFGSGSDDRTVHVALASAHYGLGHVVLFGDSSAFDDGTGDPNDTSIINGYTQNGVQHRSFILNASEWLATAFTNVTQDPPSLAVTNPSAPVVVVPTTQTAARVAGWASNVVGRIAWSNSLTGGAGTVPAGTTWVVNAIALNVGTNEIDIEATNASGVLASDGAIFVRLPPPGPPIFYPLTDVVVQVSNALQVAVVVQPTDGDAVSLTASNLPPGAQFGSTNELGSLQWTNAGPAGVYTAQLFAADVQGVAVTGLVITVLSPPGPCVETNLLLESFDLGTAVPAGWSNALTANDAVAGHYWSAPNCRALSPASYLITPPVDAPTQLVFFCDASSGGNGKTALVECAVGGGNWVTVRTFVVTTTGAMLTNDLAAVPGVAGADQVRFRFSSSFSTWYLDDVAVLGRQCGAGPAPGTYAAWAAQITNGLAGAADSALGDGIPNLLRYATGSSPLVPDDFTQVRVGLGEGGPALTFYRNTNAGDVVIVLEQSAADLAQWAGFATNIGGSWGAAPVVESGTGQPVSVQALLPAVPDGRQALRVRVLQP